MVLMNFHDVAHAKTPLLGAAYVGLLIVGGAIWGAIMYAVIRAIAKRRTPPPGAT
jgi:hypothetical protein